MRPAIVTGAGDVAAVADANARFSLLCRSGSTLCAIPLSFVVETMRPLPLVPLPGAPPSVAGVSIVRGEPLPVIHAHVLLGGVAETPSRFVILKTATHMVGLAVAEVAGIRSIPDDLLRGLPPLSGRQVAAVGNLGALDGELLLLLDTTRIVPEQVFELLSAQDAAS